MNVHISKTGPNFMDALRMASATNTTSTEKKKVLTVTDPKVDAAVRDKLVTARIALLLKAPFFGTLATRLELVNADKWLPTAATDGKHFYYNSEFVNKLSDKQTQFLQGHEVLHVVYNHMDRRGDRDPQLSNIAADYAVNQDLVDQRIGEKITLVPILYDTRFSGMCYEEIYDVLHQEADKIDMKKLADSLLDEHMDGDDEDGEGKDGDPSDGSGPHKMTKEERKALRDELREAVLQAAENAGGAGNLPAGVRRLINAFTEPQMNWREIIRQQVQSLVRSDYTFMRASRRSWHMDAILPGSDRDTEIEVDVSIDMSGSITNAMAADMLSEVKGIMQAFDSFKLRVWTFDTQVYGYKEFTPDNVDELDEYEAKGGGGTSFECNWEFMKENDIAPKLFIMMTDGYPCGGWCTPGDEEYCDTLFLIHGTTSIVAPFGQTAYYKFKNEKV